MPSMNRDVCLLEGARENIVRGTAQTMTGNNLSVKMKLFLPNKTHLGKVTSGYSCNKPNPNSVARITKQTQTLP